MEVKGKTAIITGATSGIGRMAALNLAAKGAILVLPVRNIEKGEALKKEIQDKSQKAVVELMPCDLASMNAIREFADAFRAKHDRLHILINNAGIWEMKRRESADGIEMNFAVNHLAPFLLTNLLLDIIKASAPARIVNVSSMIHKRTRMKFDDLEKKKRWSSMHAYAQSKLANVLFTRKLARYLEGSGVIVNCLHPGVVNTRLFDQMPSFMLKIFQWFMISPEKGAQTTIHLATSPALNGISGEYFAKSKAAKTSRHAKDMKVAEQLWEVSEVYCGLKNNNLCL